MPGKPLQARQLESGLAGLADRRPATLVLVVGGDIADPGVQPHPVVALPHQGALGAHGRRVADRVQMRPFGLDVPERRLDPGPAGRGAPTAERRMGRAEPAEPPGAAAGPRWTV